ncbi:MAG: hypothetical protein J0I41_14390 [Filimonas sp.]|nr:hypothetical protein [Filimonas sp.]
MTEQRTLTLKNILTQTRIALLVLLLLCIGTSCKHSDKKVSFYFWRTSFKLNETERATLAANHVDTLFTRYFDVAFAATDSAPRPEGVIRFSDSVKQVIVPVIFIRNSVFEKTDSGSISGLRDSIYSLLTRINTESGITISQVQFDCDWTEGTKNKYFYFLQQFKQKYPLRLSATIRLHQVKYRLRTGVPPVDYGVLMYYNMGAINAGDLNSVYDKNVADKYNAYVKSYPMPLDVALPVFAWGIQIRNGRVVGLLNKMNRKHFENDANFKAEGKDRFVTVQAGFKGGYYFQQGDEIKIEHIREDDLKEMCSDIIANPLYPVHRVIFYDLDESNIQQYDQKIFQAIADRIR